MSFFTQPLVIEQESEEESEEETEEETDDDEDTEEDEEEVFNYNIMRVHAFCIRACLIIYLC